MQAILKFIKNLSTSGTLKAESSNVRATLKEKFVYVRELRHYIQVRSRTCIFIGMFGAMLCYEGIRFY